MAESVADLASRIPFVVPFDPAIVAAMKYARHSREATVRGVHMPGPRPTGWAWLYIGLYVALPVMTLALLLDVILYFLADRVFGVCYAVLCLF
jgi:hypothetical protein